jgi:hypothetical protein
MIRFAAVPAQLLTGAISAPSCQPGSATMNDIYANEPTPQSARKRARTRRSVINL